MLNAINKRLLLIPRTAYLFCQMLLANLESTNDQGFFKWKFSKIASEASI
jgi:hypothetical protein